MNNLSEKLGICEVCGVNEAIYTCPKCEVRTCCLDCVNIHKKELQCDGIRDKTKFVPLKKFTNLDLLSDYRLMEDITRSVDRFKNDKTRYCTRINKDLPVHLFRLKAASLRRDTLLKFLPKNFTRHKENTTYLDWKSQLIYWRIQWIFPDAGNLKLYTPLCLETEKLGSLINNFFDPDKTDNVVSEKLMFYQSVGLNGVKLYLKAEDCPGTKYYEVDMTATVRDCLKCKVVIEYPTIHIVMNENAEAYDVIDTDEELEETENKKIVNGNTILKLTNLKRKENEDKKKNLLFISEYSDDDLSISSSDDELKPPKIKIPKRVI